MQDDGAPASTASGIDPPPRRRHPPHTHTLSSDLDSLHGLGNCVFDDTEDVHAADTTAMHAPPPPHHRTASFGARFGAFCKRIACFHRRRKDTHQSHWSHNSSFLGQAHTTATHLPTTADNASRSHAQHTSGFRLSFISAWQQQHDSKTDEQLAADKALKAQVAHYSTMRVHMKRVQLCLEQEKRNKFYKELVVYLVFLSVIMVALLSLPIHFPYEQNAALFDLFFDEEFPDIAIKKTFDDVMTEDELWQWVNGPLLSGYYDPPIRNNRRIGSIQVRSGRVNGALCSKTQGRNDFVLFDGDICYPEFSHSHESTTPFGDATTSLLGQAYTYTSELGTLERSQTFNPSLLSHGMGDYGDGGYVVYLPRDNATAGEAVVAQLAVDFLSDATRYVATSFAFYNPRSSLFTHVQALVEMSDTDYIETTARVKSFRILASYKDAGAFIEDNAFVIVLVLATLWLIGRELTDVREYGVTRYVHSLWNVLDMIQLILLVAFLAQWISYLIRSENLRETIHRVVHMDCNGPAHDQVAAAACFVNLQPLARNFNAVTNCAAALALVSVAIIFKYLRLNSRLNLLWRTLRFAAKDLLAFVVIFFTMFVGFAIMGFLTFGAATRQYHSISTSLTSCFQMLLGAFDYNQIYQANPTMAGIFFFSFMISIYLICVNMFIAIMSEYYSHAQTEKKTREETKRNLLRGRETGEEEENGGGGTKDKGADDGMQFTDVEYDLAKQLKAYVRGLRVHVRLPPKKNATSAYATEQLLVCGYQRVLLVDFAYLQAERKRLRAKFRAAVHTALWCLWIKRKVDPDAVFEVDLHTIPDKRPRAASIDTFMDLVEFPVTYLPISSAATDTVALLKRLSSGMHVDLDDGSLTKDQITLEVLGKQDAYVPRQFTRRALPSTSPVAALEPALDVRISTTDDDVVDTEESRSFFGLRHVHDGIGGPDHIRCCRVLYNGDTLLNGMETCGFPKRSWASYFTGHVLWRYVRTLLSFKRTKKKANRLVTDADVDKLIHESFHAPGRGISCRFDELVRNFRMFIAKKVHKRNIRVHNIDDRIMAEVITFLERFPSALTPLDKRELEGYKYTPQPVNTRHVRLPNSITLLSELLSQNAHEVWAVGRIDQGWRWGAQRDNDALLHPDLVPYEDLTEQDKQYDRDTSIETLKVITALGYILEPPPPSSSADDDFDIEFGEPALEIGGTYVPKPIPTDKVKVPGYLRSVIELLAENTHEVWAKMRMEQGWKFGPRRNDETKEHNGLVPYMYLTHDEKQMDRNTAMQTVKVILRCGFVFTHKDQTSASTSAHRRPRRNPSGQLSSVFGRSENVDMRHVGDAVALARGTARARRAFMKKNNSTRGFASHTSSSIGGVHSSGGGGNASFRSAASFESNAPPLQQQASMRSFASLSSQSSFQDFVEPLTPAIESTMHSSEDDDESSAASSTDVTETTTRSGPALSHVDETQSK